MLHMQHLLDEHASMPCVHASQEEQQCTSQISMHMPRPTCVPSADSPKGTARKACKHTCKEPNHP